MVETFASRLHDRNEPSRYVSEDAYRRYLATHPNDESRFFEPIDQGGWSDDEQIVSEFPSSYSVRGAERTLPTRAQYREHGIELSDPERVYAFELCRFTAAVARYDVLATKEERRVSVLPELGLLLQLEEWHHPDVVAGERPSEVESFRQLAQVLATGDTSCYRPTTAPNTHWRNWPEGGTL